MIGAGVPVFAEHDSTCSPDVGIPRENVFEYFVQRCQQFADREPPNLACPKIAALLAHVITDPYFIETVIGDRKGRNTVYEKIGGLTVLAHFHPHEVWSEPHDHGRTWAIYGVATGKTGMHEWDLVEPRKNGKRGKVKLARSYWIMPGEVHYYPIKAIHSHHTYDESRLIRIEGLNLHRRENKPGGQKFDQIV